MLYNGRGVKQVTKVEGRLLYLDGWWYPAVNRQRMMFTFAGFVPCDLS